MSWNDMEEEIKTTNVIIMGNPTKNEWNTIAFLTYWRAYMKQLNNIKYRRGLKKMNLSLGMWAGSLEDTIL